MVCRRHTEPFSDRLLLGACSLSVHDDEGFGHSRRDAGSAVYQRTCTTQEPVQNDKRKAPHFCGALGVAPKARLPGRLVLVHSAHAAVAAGSCHFLLLFRKLANQRFGGEHQASDGAGVLQGSPRNLGWIDHASLNQVFELAGLGVVAEVRILRFADLTNHDRAFFAGVADDLTQRLFQSALYDLRADGFFAADRKSTRLNSSHVSISYAVFCLKKKKKNIKLI